MASEEHGKASVLADVTGVAAQGEINDDFPSVFAEHVRAAYPCIYIPTSEEGRVEAEIREIAKRQLNKYAIIKWDEFEGFEGNDRLKDKKYCGPPIEALNAIADNTNFGQQPTICIMRDADDYFAIPAVRRRIRSLCSNNRITTTGSRRVIVILSPSAEIHPRIRSHIATIEFKLPDEPQLVRVIRGLQAALNAKSVGGRANRGDCSDELVGKIARCLLGLTSNEAENCVARCLIRHGGFVPEMLATIKDEKASHIKKSETLTYVSESQQAARSEIAGYDAFLDWLSRRTKAYTPAARVAKIDYPRGVVLLGPPGTYKSGVAMAAGAMMGLPVYLFDVAAVFDKHVGGSEQRMRDALKQVEAQQGCVLLVDEADKALGNAADSTGDSGVTRRVFGTFLHWLATNQSGTFVIMTVNRTEGLPPELLRPGRFDAVFYTEMPKEKERREILEIHLRKRGVPPESLSMGDEEWGILVDKTDGFVGSEIEEVVKEARYMSFDKRDVASPTFEELLKAASGITPMSSRDKEGMKRILEYCTGKGRPVTSPVITKKGRTASREVDIR